MFNQHSKTLRHREMRLRSNKNLEEEMILKLEMQTLLSNGKQEAKRWTALLFLKIVPKPNTQVRACSLSISCVFNYHASPFDLRIHSWQINFFDQIWILTNNQAQIQLQ